MYQEPGIRNTTLKRHVKVYLTHFNYDISDFVPCEMCGDRAVDVHHIERRGMGGSKHKDVIENLMALCRLCHNQFGDKKEFKQDLIIIHNKFLKDDGTIF